MQGQFAVRLIQKQAPAVILLDLWLEEPGMIGLIWEHLAHTPVTQHIPIIGLARYHEQLPSTVRLDQPIIRYPCPSDLVILALQQAVYARRGAE